MRNHLHPTLALPGLILNCFPAIFARRSSCKYRVRFLPSLCTLICALLIANCALWRNSTAASVDCSSARKRRRTSPVHLRDYSAAALGFPKFLQPYTPRQLELLESGQLAAH